MIHYELYQICVHRQCWSMIRHVRTMCVKSLVLWLVLSLSMGAVLQPLRFGGLESGSWLQSAQAMLAGGIAGLGLLKSVEQAKASICRIRYPCPPLSFYLPSMLIKTQVWAVLQRVHAAVQGHAVRVSHPLVLMTAPEGQWITAALRANPGMRIRAHCY